MHLFTMSHIHTLMHIPFPLSFSCNAYPYPFTHTCSHSHSFFHYPLHAIYIYIYIYIYPFFLTFPYTHIKPYSMHWFFHHSLYHFSQDSHTHLIYSIIITYTYHILSHTFSPSMHALSIYHFDNNIIIDHSSIIQHTQLSCYFHNSLFHALNTFNT